jgi:hypothetical protein
LSANIPRLRCSARADNAPQLKIEIAKLLKRGLFGFASSLSRRLQGFDRFSPSFRARRC